MSGVQTPPDEDFLRAFKELQRKVEDISNNSITGNQLVTGDLVGGFGASRVGCLLCNGATILDTDYPALGAYIRANLPVAYIVDSTHVKVPDYRGAVLGGADAATFVKGTEVGVETITLISNQCGVPAHTHPVSTTDPESAHTHGFGGGGTVLTTYNGVNQDHIFQVTAGSAWSTNGGTTTGAGSSHTHGIPLTPANGAQNAASSHGNVQPTLPANIFIKI